METLSQDRLTYESYLRIPELLQQQQLLSSHHDEMLFILIHQTYELWFKEILHEAAELLRCFRVDDVQRAIKVLNRLLTIQKVMISQIDVLETMTPTEFAAFRDQLRPASGFQSVQFRELEFFCGLKNPRFLQYFAGIPGSKARLETRMAEPTLYDAFLHMLSRRGFTIPETVLNRDVTLVHQEDAGIVDAIAAIYNDASTHFELYMLCEAMLNFDENLNFWRYRHVKMVERTIGMKTGTGGSTGAVYLAETLKLQCFPELWSVRSHIGSY